MRLSRPLAVAALTAGVVLGTTNTVSAGLTVNFGSDSHVFSGTIPVPTGVYATATFEYIDSDSVKVTFAVPMNYQNLHAKEFGFEFNATGASFNHTGGVAAISTNFDATGIPVSGTGNEKFNTNIAFDNAQANRVKFGQSSEYQIDFTGANLANNLGNLFKGRVDKRGNPIPYTSAVHIGGYDPDSGGKMRKVPGSPGTFPRSPSRR